MTIDLYQENIASYLQLIIQSLVYIIIYVHIYVDEF